MSTTFLMSDDALLAASKNGLASNIVTGPARAKALGALVKATNLVLGKYAAMCQIAITLGDFEDTRQTVIAAVMADSLAISFDAAAHALTLPGASSKEDVKRDAEAEKAYASARVFWQRVRIACGFAAPTGSGSKTGTRAPKVTAATAATTPAPVTAPVDIKSVAVPHVADMDDAATFLRSAAAKLSQFQKENAAKLVDAKGAAIRDAIEAFNRAVKLIQAMDGDAVDKLAKSVAKGAKAETVAA